MVNLQEDGSGFRSKKEGPINFIYIGKRHIGNVIDPVLGGDSRKARKYTAITKDWGTKQSHDSKQLALKWLQQKHMNRMTARLSEGIESKTVGTTPNSRLQANIEKTVNRVNKRDPNKLVTTPGYTGSTVSEVFLRVYNEAKTKLGKEREADGFDNGEGNPNMVAMKDDTFQITKTDVGGPGVVIKMQPVIASVADGKDPKQKPVSISTDHKSKPQT